MECMVQPLDSGERALREDRILTFLLDVFGHWPAGLTVEVGGGKIVTTMTAEQRQTIMQAHAEIHRKWPAVFYGFNGAGEAVWRPRYGCADNNQE